MKRLIVNGIYIVIIAGIIFMGLSSFDGSRESSLIEGNTPFEKVASMVKYLNAQKGNDFAKVYFQEYDRDNGIWRYGITGDPSLWTKQTTPQEQQLQQQKKELFNSIIRNLFVNTAQWDKTARWIVVTTVYPIPLENSVFGNVSLPVYGHVYFSNDIGTANIREYPTEWEKYTNASGPEKYFGFAESVFQSTVQKIIQGSSSETSGAKAPIEDDK